MRHKKHKKPFIRLGGIAEPAGYCRYHRKVMSRNQIKAKQCVEKNCGWLKPYRDPFERACLRAAEYEAQERLYRQEQTARMAARAGNAGDANKKEEPDMDKKPYVRICVQRSGYAIVPNGTPEEIRDHAMALRACDFDWEPVTPDMVAGEMEVIEETDFPG